MGLIWDLLQQNQINESQQHAQDLESRVQMLELQLKRTNEALLRVVQELERRYGEDLNGDNRVG